MTYLLLVDSTSPVSFCHQRSRKPHSNTTALTHKDGDQDASQPNLHGCIRQYSDYWRRHDQRNVVLVCVMFVSVAGADRKVPRGAAVRQRELILTENN